MGANEIVNYLIVDNIKKSLTLQGGHNQGGSSFSDCEAIFLNALQSKSGEKGFFYQIQKNTNEKSLINFSFKVLPHYSVGVQFSRFIRNKITTSTKRKSPT